MTDPMRFPFSSKTEGSTPPQLLRQFGRSSAAIQLNCLLALSPHTPLCPLGAEGRPLEGRPRLTRAPADAMLHRHLGRDIRTARCSNDLMSVADCLAQLPIRMSRRALVQHIKGGGVDTYQEWRRQIFLTPEQWAFQWGGLSHARAQEAGEERYLPRPRHTRRTAYPREYKNGFRASCTSHPGQTPMRDPRPADLWRGANIDF